MRDGKVKVAMYPYQEIVLALRIMRGMTSKASGRNWSALYERFPDDVIALGVVDETDAMVMGDSITQDGVREADAEFIAMMDPQMAWYVISFLETAQVNIRQGSWSPHMQRNALEMARHLNRKYPNGE